MVNRDITSLMRTTPQASTIPPQIAALVSHKYQFTLNVTSRAFQKADYSYQVKSIDRIYGRQPKIPEVRALPAASSVDNKKAIISKGKRKIGETSTEAADMSIPSTDLLGTGSPPLAITDKTSSQVTISEPLIYYRLCYMYKHTDIFVVHCQLNRQQIHQFYIELLHLRNQ